MRESTKYSFEKKIFTTIFYSEKGIIYLKMENKKEMNLKIIHEYQIS